MRIYMDWEGHLLQKFAMDSRLVCLGYLWYSSQGQPQHGGIASHDAEPFLNTNLSDPASEWAAFNAAFDFTQTLGKYPHLARQIFNKFEEKRVVCGKIGDQIVSIASGTFKRRGFTLRDSYRTYTGKDISEVKGMDHPIIGASRRAKKKWALKQAWIGFLGAALDAYSQGQYAKARPLFAKAFEIVPLKDTPWRYLYGMLEGIDFDLYPEDAAEYVISDCYELADVLEGVSRAAESLGYADEQGLPLDIAEETYYDFALQLTAQVGFFTDRPYVAELRKEAEKTVRTLQPVLKTEGLLQIVKSGERKGQIGKDTKAIRAMVRWASESAGLPVPLTKSKKNIAADSETLKELPGRLPEMYGAYQDARNMLDKHLPIIERYNPKTGFRSMVVTARVASGADEGDEFNSTNLKRKGGVRPAFIPPTKEEALIIMNRLGLPEGAKEVARKTERYVMVGADYAQLELYPLATRLLYEMNGGRIEYESGISPLADALFAEIDVHSRVGCKILEMEYDLFRQGVKANPNGPEAEARQDQKPCTYGVPGLMGPNALAIFAKTNYGRKYCTFSDGSWDISGSVEFADYLIQLYLSEFWDIREYRQLFFKRGEGQTAIAVPEMSIRANCNPKQAANYGFQKPSSKITKRALAWLWRVCFLEESMWGCIPFGYVHDELLMYVPIEIIHRAAMRMKRLMLDSKEQSCPGLTHDSDVEPVAMPFWAKGAKPAFNSKGELILTKIEKKVEHPERPWGNSPVAWLLGEDPLAQKPVPGRLITDLYADADNDSEDDEDEAAA